MLTSCEERDPLGGLIIDPLEERRIACPIWFGTDSRSTFRCSGRVSCSVITDHCLIFNTGLAWTLDGHKDSMGLYFVCTEWIVLIAKTLFCCFCCCSGKSLMLACDLRLRACPAGPAMPCLACIALLSGLVSPGILWVFYCLFWLPWTHYYYYY